MAGAGRVNSNREVAAVARTTAVTVVEGEARAAAAYARRSAAARMISPRLQKTRSAKWRAFAARSRLRHSGTASQWVRLSPRPEEKKKKKNEDEQIAANLVLGIKETAFLHYPDGELVASLQLRKDLTRLIRLYKPDLVVTSDPTRVFYGSDYTNHPDHRAAAEAGCICHFPFF